MTCTYFAAGKLDERVKIRRGAGGGEIRGAFRGVVVVVLGMPRRPTVPNSRRMLCGSVQCVCRVQRCATARFSVRRRVVCFGQATCFDAFDAADRPCALLRL